MTLGDEDGATEIAIAGPSSQRVLPALRLSNFDLPSSAEEGHCEASHGFGIGPAAGLSRNNAILIDGRSLPRRVSAYLPGNHTVDAGPSASDGRVGGCSKFANYWLQWQPSSRSPSRLPARRVPPTRCKPARLDIAASTMASDPPAATASAMIALAAIRGNGCSTNDIRAAGSRKFISLQLYCERSK